MVIYAYLGYRHLRAKRSAFFFFSREKKKKQKEKRTKYLEAVPIAEACRFAVKIHAVAIGTASYATVDRSEICVRRKRTLLLRTGVDNLPFMWYIYNNKSEIHHIFKEDDFYDQRGKTKN